MDRHVENRSQLLTAALDWLVQYYEATNKPDEAAKWRAELEAVKARENK